MKTQNNTPELIGQYINKVLWSDVEPIGYVDIFINKDEQNII